MSPGRPLIVGILVVAVGLGFGALLGSSMILTPLTAPLSVVLVGGAIAAVAYLPFRRKEEPTE